VGWSTNNPHLPRSTLSVLNAVAIPKLPPPSAPETVRSRGPRPRLEKQASALESRHEIEVEATLCDEPEASLEAKETDYRMIQEALHNTLKHARATNVGI
jgi:hypothetical protein